MPLPKASMPQLLLDLFCCISPYSSKPKQLEENQIKLNKPKQNQEHLETTQKQKHKWFSRVFFFLFGFVVFVALLEPTNQTQCVVFWVFSCPLLIRQETFCFCFWAPKAQTTKQTQGKPKKTRQASRKPNSKHLRPLGLLGELVSRGKAFADSIDVLTQHSSALRARTAH